MGLEIHPVKGFEDRIHLTRLASRKNPQMSGRHHQELRQGEEFDRLQGLLELPVRKETEHVMPLIRNLHCHA